MNALLDYIKEAYLELVNKVTWPSFAELQNSAVVVLIASLLIAFLVWGMDIGSNNMSTFIYKTLMNIGS